MIDTCLTLAELYPWIEANHIVEFRMEPVSTVLSDGFDQFLIVWQATTRGLVGCVSLL